MWDLLGDGEVPGGWVAAGEGGLVASLENICSWIVGFKCQAVGLDVAWGLWELKQGLK